MNHLSEFTHKIERISRNTRSVLHWSYIHLTQMLPNMNIKLPDIKSFRIKVNPLYQK